MFLDDTNQLRNYRDILDDMAGLALSPSDSIVFMDSLLKEL
ncbi:hypothetical protein J2S46_004720 [Kitasatospora herbaricolor]|nr:hypothetical protein [Kitasatospora herbaricolor]